MKDRVIFRQWRDNGDIIAVFPDNEANYGNFMMYEHIGQHGEGDYWGILPKTTPAHPLRYKPLFDELMSIGYDLRVCRRMPQDFKAWSPK